MLEIRHTKVKVTADTREAYNYIYLSRGIQLPDSFYLWVISLLKPKPGCILVDVSCGQGRLIYLARQKGLHAIGIDFAIEGVRKGQRGSPSSDWAVGDGESLPFSEKCADYVIHIGSLEHYMNPEQGAKEITRILKPGGRACILLPNAFGLLGNIHHVWATGDIFDDGQPLQRYATRRQWEKLLTSVGLQIENTLGYGEVELPRTMGDALQMLKRPVRILRLILTPLVPTNLKNHFIFICTRA